MANVREKVIEAALVSSSGCLSAGGLFFSSWYPEPEWSSWFGGHAGKIMRKFCIALFATCTILYVSFMILHYTGIIERCKARRHVAFANIQPFRMFPHYDRPPLPQQVLYNVHYNRVRSAYG